MNADKSKVAQEIIHRVFSQYYKNTVLLPLTYDNLEELEAELIAEIKEGLQ